MNIQSCSPLPPTRDVTQDALSQPQREMLKQRAREADAQRPEVS